MPCLHRGIGDLYAEKAGLIDNKRKQPLWFSLFHFSCLSTTNYLFALDWHLTKHPEFAWVLFKMVTLLVISVIKIFSVQNECVNVCLKNSSELH